MSITGHQIDLSHGGHVFIAEKDNEHYFRFTNAEGEATKFKLSSEATIALIQLLTSSLPSTLELGVGNVSGDLTAFWRVVPRKDAEA